MAKKAPTEPPTEALPDRESNRFVAKFKTALCKRWSYTSMGTLYDISTLAAFLWALERDQEALAIAASVAAEVPAPPPTPNGGVNYNVWCPATVSHALLVHLAGTQGSWQERAEASRQALACNSGIAKNPQFLSEAVEEAEQAAAAPADPKMPKQKVERLAYNLGNMVLYVELALAGHSFFDASAEKARPLLPQLRSKLGTQLQGK
jgi:hypothetical protein